MDKNTQPTESRRDVPLKHAMLLWNRKDDRPYGDGRMEVIEHPEKDTRTWTLTCSTGACCAEWTQLNTEERLAKLYVEAWHIACRDGVALKTIHEALMVIPEYRETLSGEPFFMDTKAP